MRFEVFQGRKVTWDRTQGGDWYWRLKSANNQIVAQSEGYTRRNGAERAARNLAQAMKMRLATVKVIA